MGPFAIAHHTEMNPGKTGSDRAAVRDRPVGAGVGSAPQQHKVSCALPSALSAQAVDRRFEPVGRRR